MNIRSSTPVFGMNNYFGTAGAGSDPTQKSNLSDSLEKISSAYVKYRRFDDASALSVSKNMRAQISSLSSRTNEYVYTVSMIQTVDNALSETQSLIERARSLAAQSAGSDEPDRKAIDDEYRKICDRINEIAMADYTGNAADIDNSAGVSASENDGTKTEAVSAVGITESSYLLGNSFAIEYIDSIDPTESGRVSTSKPVSSSTMSAGDVSQLETLLKSQIVPNVVNQLIKAYPAFNYLSGRTIYTALNIYEDQGSSTMASMGISYESYGSDSTKGFILNVNAKYTDKMLQNTDEGKSQRTQLEKT